MPVAVLIVNYHVYDALDRALGSLEPFLASEDEVIVFDQESEDGPRSALEGAHPRVRVVAHDGNIGFAAAVNRAARLSSAPFLLWLNPDTLVEAPVIDVLEDWLDEHPNVAVAGPRVLDPDGAVQASARRFPGITTALAGRSTWLTRHFPRNPLSERNLPARQATEPVVVDWVAGSCLMTRRDVFERLGGLDEGFFLYWEDADYCRRAAEAGLGCTMYLPHVSVRHRAGLSAAVSPEVAIRAFHESAYRLYRKHASPWQRLALPLAGAALRARGAIQARRRR